MTIGRYDTRVRIDINEVNQFSILPALGVTWGHNHNFRFYIAAMWLNVQIRIGVFKRKNNG